MVDPWKSHSTKIKNQSLLQPESQRDDLCVLAPLREKVAVAVAVGSRQ
jgi:hypothetical protein